MNIEAAYPGAAPTGVACTGVTWTTERIQQLQQCVVAGLTCSQIAGEIGVTRNAVIGKLHRLGLSTAGRPGRKPAALAGRMRSASPTHRAPTRLSRIARLLRAAEAGSAVLPFRAAVEMMETIEMPPVESAKRCALLDLALDGCRWPLGDPGKADFGFCGNHAIAGFSYCAGHARIAYRLPSGRRA